MRHINRRYAQILLQMLDLAAHGQAQAGVQIGQGFVKEQHIRFFHQGAPQSDALLLPAGKLPRAPIEQLANAHHVGHLPHSFILHVLGNFFQLERIGDILEDGHVRIEGIALEDHADIAILRLHGVDHAFTKANEALSWFVDAGQRQQRCRFATTRGTQEGDKLAIVNMKRQILDANDIAEFLGQVVNSDFHCLALPADTRYELPLAPPA